MLHVMQPCVCVCVWPRICYICFLFKEIISISALSQALYYLSTSPLTYVFSLSLSFWRSCCLLIQVNWWLLSCVCWFDYWPSGLAYPISQKTFLSWTFLYFNSIFLMLIKFKKSTTTTTTKSVYTANRNFYFLFQSISQSLIQYHKPQTHTCACVLFVDRFQHVITKNKTIIFFRFF